MRDNFRPPCVLIAGASVRAAAESAARSGWGVLAADRYGDADLGLFAETLTLAVTPRALGERSKTRGVAGWMYTGGWENWPRRVGQLAARIPLWGNGPAVLRQVRDPFWVAELLAAAKVETPELRATGETLPRDGTWLRKARRGSGGSQVAPWTGDARADDPRYYFQRRSGGQPAAAIFVAAAGRARRLGLAEQLLSPTHDGRAPFRYGGSLGPLDVSTALGGCLDRLGQALAAQAGLQGVFGVDGLIDGDRFIVVEINPRWTASVEVLESAGLGSAFALHRAACCEGRLTDAAPPSGPGWHGKQIVYAPQELKISARVSERLLAARGDWPKRAMADIPRADSTITPDAPLLTVMATATTREQLLARLDERTHGALEIARHG